LGFDSKGSSIYKRVRFFFKRIIWTNTRLAVKALKNIIISMGINFPSNTNASAESFNAKLKAFRVSLRGVRDINFFLFRVAKIYA